ncbi:hypothetical protein [Pseudochrobactrum sp. HB0163]|uniref:hypothetical protein n=1 Tax=Pseudochrobactrum sp. HB0163 TaxID=3450708 RepID=UPI003F6DE4E0
MMTDYELLQEPTDSWAIFETASGEPVMIEGRPMIGLSEAEAQQIYAALIAPVKVTAPTKERKKSAA